MIPYDKRNGKIWYNNDLVDWQDVKLHVLSHGLHYASCVFEGERVYDGEIFKLEEHSFLKKVIGVSIIFFVLQVALGISNVVYSLPLNIAVWHTMNAAILMALISGALYYSLISFTKT